VVHFTKKEQDKKASLSLSPPPWPKPLFAVVFAVLDELFGRADISRSACDKLLVVVLVEEGNLRGIELRTDLPHEAAESASRPQLQEVVKALALPPSFLLFLYLPHGLGKKLFIN